MSAPPKKWKDPFPSPVIQTIGRFQVVRDDLLQCGSKSRFADLYISRSNAKHFIYAAPRVGYAASALALICAKHGKRLTIFTPACRELSDYQLLPIELGAEVRTVRIAAQPVLNSYAKRFSDSCGAEFIPLGLRHDLVNQAIFEVASEIKEPEELWSVAGSGVLTCGLQHAWPNARFFAVAVGHKLKPEERGRAVVIEYHKPFSAKSDIKTPFPSVETYDAKGWEIMQYCGTAGALFWNVAGPVKTNLKPCQFQSDRSWSDLSDLDPEKKPICL